MRIKLIIKKNNSGNRIDKFLKKEVFFNEEIARGEIIRQIKNGNVLANGKIVKPSHILKENDKLEINLKTTSNELVANKKIKLEIIFEDKNVIAINKPAGMQVHPDFHEKNNTLVNGLVAKFPEIKNVGDPSTSSWQVNMRPGIVHRLDKDTSGVIIIARNQNTFEELKKKFKNREIEKKYWAIVYGKLEKKEGIINKPLARSTTYKKQVIAGKKTETKIREAVTIYKVLKEWDNFSLLEVTPKTGRMHQIRVHLTSIGHPIVGDKIYKEKHSKSAEVPRQMLHAKNLSFDLTGKRYSFQAELPDDFSLFMGYID